MSPELRAEVAFCPNDGNHRKEGPVARRYLAIRIKKKQGVLFADGSDRKHFAVVTNLDWAGDTILDWPSSFQHLSVSPNP